MSEYQFVHRFSSPKYWLVYSVTGVITVLLFTAAFYQPICWVFGCLFALVTARGIRSIVKGDTAGSEICDGVLTCWLTGPRSKKFSIDLETVTTLRYKRQASEVIYLDVQEGQSITIDERFFGEVCALVEAICSANSEIKTVCISGPRCQFSP